MNNIDSPEQKSGKNKAILFGSIIAVLILLLIGGIILFSGNGSNPNGGNDPSNDPVIVDPKPDTSDVDYTDENGVKIHKPWENVDNAKVGTNIATAGGEIAIRFWPGVEAKASTEFFVHPYDDDFRMDGLKDGSYVIPYSIHVMNYEGKTTSMQVSDVIAYKESDNKGKIDVFGVPNFHTPHEFRAMSRKSQPGEQINSYTTGSRFYGYIVIYNYSGSLDDIKLDTPYNERPVFKVFVMGDPSGVASQTTYGLEIQSSKVEIVKLSR